MVLASDNSAVSSEFRARRADALRCSALEPLDPLDEDRPCDGAFLLSARQVARLAAIASATGSRFAQEHIPAEAMDWLYAPRALFAGRPAIPACCDLDHFRRAMLLHGLSLGFDALPATIDAFLEEAVLPEVDAEGSIAPDGGGNVELDRPGLFTATISDRSMSGTLQVFVARIARSVAEMESRISERFGVRLAAVASVRAGFDPLEPVAMTLVSQAVSDTLVRIAEDPFQEMAGGLIIHLESRFSR